MTDQSDILDELYATKTQRTLCYAARISVVLFFVAAGYAVWHPTAPSALLALGFAGVFAASIVAGTFNEWLWERR